MLSCHAALPEKLQLTSFCYKIQKHPIASSVQITNACCKVTLSDSLCKIQNGATKRHQGELNICS